VCTDNVDLERRNAHNATTPTPTNEPTSSILIQAILRLFEHLAILKCKIGTVFWLNVTCHVPGTSTAVTSDTVQYSTAGYSTV
jgi:hypothetical protein